MFLHCPPHLLAYCSPLLRSSSPRCCTSALTHNRSPLHFLLLYTSSGSPFLFVSEPKLPVSPLFQAKDTPLWCFTFLFQILHISLLSPSPLLFAFDVQTDRKFMLI